MGLGMREGLWTEVEPSQFPHEREALDFVRRRLPDREPWRAWSNFTFIDSSGRPSEVDLLVVAPRGVVLVEIKSYPDGELDGDARTWRWKPPGKDLRSYDNPFLAADGKAKRLKSLLLSRRALRGGPNLWVDAVVFLSSPHLKVSLRERVTGVFGPDAADGDEQANKLPGLIAYLKEVDAGRGARIDRPLSAAIARAMDQADIRESEKYRNAGHYQLMELLDEGETWQDYRASHKVARVEKRARLHLRSRGADEAERESINRAAEREFRLLAQLDHPGIERPDDLAPNPRGLATLYPYDPEAVRLDHWMDTRPDADLSIRLALLRNVAEAVAHAHEHGLAHRALTPRHVWITGPDGTPTPRLRGWTTAARDTTTSISHSDGTRHPGHFLRFAGEGAGPYLAPELRTVPEASGRLADVFSLGGLAHLLLSGQPPAADADELQRTLDEHGCVPLSAAMDAAPSALVDVVAGATYADVSERFPSVAELLAWLDVAEDELTAPEEVDLLTAGRGTTVAGWNVLARLGAGGSSVVLLAERDGKTEVLKVARDADHGQRLHDEHDVLDRLRHPTVIATYGITDIGAHTVLRLQPGLTRRKGEAHVADTLAERLRTDGPPTLDLLQRWGTDLLDALVELEREGVDHRDLKPENLVFIERGQYKERHLAVIDFSLTKAPKSDVNAGTVGYLDPFLPDRPDRGWDLHAERYAAGVVLTELATGERPTWGAGADPRSTDVAVPDLRADVVDPAIREPLVALLHRLVHRDITQRFDTADDARRAWERVFTDVDVSTGHSTGVSADELDLAGLTATTPIRELGLAPRLAGAVERLGAADVGALARLPANQLTLSGVGAAVRRELRHLVRRLRDGGLAEEPEQLGDLDDADLARLSVDRLAERLVPARSNLTAEQRHLLDVLLGVKPDTGQTWPTLSRTAEVLGADATQVAAELDKARKRWAEYRPELVGLRESITEWLAGRGGVATGAEITGLLLARRGSIADEPHRSHRARAVVRACLEAEAWISQPRFRGVRVGEQLLLALDRPAAVDGRGTIEWVADPLVEAAAGLGERADQLVADESVVGPATALQALRDIDWPLLPEGVRFDDARLVQLAAAASTTAAVSSRGELYPRGLPAFDAVKAGRLALLGRGGLTAEQVQQRVHARFPQAAPLPSRPELDRILDEAEAGLQWVADPGRYVLADTSAVITSSSTWTGTRYASVDEADAEAADMDRRIQRLQHDGGFLSATVEPRRLDLAARMLATRLDAPLLDLDAELIAAMRQAADDAGARWDVMLDADAYPRTDPRFRALERLVVRAAEGLDQRVRTAGRLVVAADAGLLARYGRFDLVERWRDDLTRATISRDEPLAGLLLLVPGTDRDKPPIVDGTPVPIVTAGQWTRVPTSWLDRSAA